MYTPLSNTCARQACLVVSHTSVPLVLDLPLPLHLLLVMSVAVAVPLVPVLLQPLFLLSGRLIDERGVVR